MENNNDLDFIDYDEVDEVDSDYEETESEPSHEEPSATSDGDSGDQSEISSVVAFLKHNGITDPNAIKFLDENGLITTSGWDDLTGEELFLVLNELHKDPDYDPDEAEKVLLNSIRMSGLSPNEYIKLLVQSQLYLLQSQAEPSYEIDTMDDDDVFVIDLMSRVGEDISDEEINNYLNAAKQNDALFKKLVESIRNDYRLRQEEEVMQLQYEANMAAQEQYKIYENNICNSILNFSNVGSTTLELDRNDAEELASYILDMDELGVSQFSKDLMDPATQVRLAWFALHGEDFMNQIDQYIATSIKEARQNGYDTGLAKYNESPKVVIKNEKHTQLPVGKKSKNINTGDLDSIDY